MSEKGEPDGYNSLYHLRAGLISDWNRSWKTAAQFMAGIDISILLFTFLFVFKETRIHCVCVCVNIFCDVLLLSNHVKRHNLSHQTWLCGMKTIPLCCIIYSIKM